VINGTTVSVILYQATWEGKPAQDIEYSSARETATNINNEKNGIYSKSHN